MPEISIEERTKKMVEQFKECHSSPIPWKQKKAWSLAREIWGHEVMKRLLTDEERFLIEALAS